MYLRKLLKTVVSVSLCFGLTAGSLNLLTVRAASDLTLSSIEATEVTGVTYEYKVEGDIDSITVNPVGKEPIKTPLTIDQEFSHTKTNYTTTMERVFPASFAVKATPSDPNAKVKVQYFADKNNVDYDTVKIGIDNCWLSALPAVGDKFYATVTTTGLDNATTATTVTTTIVPANSTELKKIVATEVTGVTYDYKVIGDINTIAVNPVGKEPIKTPLTIDQEFSPTTTNYTTTMVQAFPASFAVNATPANPNTKVKVQYFADKNNVDYDTVKIGIDNCWISGLPAVGDKFYATVTATASDNSTTITTVTTTIVPATTAPVTTVHANIAELKSIVVAEVTGVKYYYKVAGDINTITVNPVGKEPIKTHLTIEQEFSPTTANYNTTMTQAFPASFAVNAMPVNPNAKVKVQYFADKNNVDYDTVKIGIDNCWLSGLPAVGDKFYATVTSTIDGKQSVYTVTTTIVSPKSTAIKSSSARQVSGVTYTYKVPGDIDTVSITPIGDAPIVTSLPVVPNNLEKKYSHELKAIAPSSYAVSAIAMNPMADVKVQYFADERNVDYDKVKIGIDNCWISDTPAVGDKFYALITITSPDGESSSTYKLTASVTE